MYRRGEVSLDEEEHRRGGNVQTFTQREGMKFGIDRLLKEAAFRKRLAK
jgi:hypothetical protein